MKRRSSNLRGGNRATAHRPPASSALLTFGVDGAGYHVHVPRCSHCDQPLVRRVLRSFPWTTTSAHPLQIGWQCRTCPPPAPEPHSHCPITRSGPYPYQGPCADPPVPAAHGNVCWHEICHCGARRTVNENQGHIEKGRWFFPEGDRTS